MSREHPYLSFAKHDLAGSQHVVAPSQVAPPHLPPLASVTHISVGAGDGGVLGADVAHVQPTPSGHTLLHYVGVSEIVSEGRGQGVS